MAFSHLYFSSQVEYGGKLRSVLNLFEDSFERLIDLRDTMTLMIDGDGSSSTHFPEVTLRFGFPNDATAKAAWDEINSCLGKLTTNASVSSVNAAILQMLSKLR